MTSTTAVHALIFAALEGAGLHVVYGPADDLPAGDDGLIGQAVVLWPGGRLNAYTRATGTRSGGVDSLIATCVGATVRDALAVADKVEAAIGGLVTSPKGSPLRQTATSGRPVPEPNADPVRVSLAVEYSTVTKD